VIAFLDCWTGISGDKFLGALIDAGAPLEAVQAVCPALGLAGVEVRVERRVRHGISALHLTVEDTQSRELRKWPEIRDRVEAADLPERVRRRSLTALLRLAEAEAKVHEVPLEGVHFHEVGAADTLVDIVGTMVALDALGVERVVSTPVAVGSGTVQTQHGLLPVPAPATAELLRAVPVVAGPAEGELTTPTGAALVSTLVAEFGPMPPMTPAAIGYGVGLRELPVANVARVILGIAVGESEGEGWSLEDVVVLETNVDHLSAERLAFAAEELLAAGALDVWSAPIVMKKGRPAHTLSVMTPPAEADRLTALLFELTATLGVRRTTSPRAVLPRRVVEVDTPFGRVRVKLATAPSGRLLARAEYDDAARLARESGADIGEVAAAAEAAAREAHGNSED